MPLLEPQDTFTSDEDWDAALEADVRSAQADGSLADTILDNRKLREAWEEYFFASIADRVNDSRIEKQREFYEAMAEAMDGIQL